jgi:hypothetical protein
MKKALLFALALTASGCADEGQSALSERLFGAGVPEDHVLGYMWYNRSAGQGYLFASHPLFEDLFATLRTLISLGCQKIHPHIGKHVIFRHHAEHTCGPSAALSHDRDYTFSGILTHRHATGLATL